MVGCSCAYICDLLVQIHIQGVDHFGKRIGFVKFQCDANVTVSNDTVETIPVPGIVFMRGSSVGILVILECEGKEYTLLTYQARVPVGNHNLPEIPAGMMDGRGNFRGAAAEEIEQECDIVISETDLVDLTALAYGDAEDAEWKGIAPSPGGCDEWVRLYLLRRCVTKDVLEQLEGRLTGVRTLPSVSNVSTCTALYQ